MKGAMILEPEKCNGNALVLGVRRPSPSLDWAGASHTPKGGFHFMSIKYKGLNFHKSIYVLTFWDSITRFSEDSEKGITLKFPGF